MTADGYQEHADALMPALLPLYATLDPDTYGGAVLLGVDGVCVISHGSIGRDGDGQRHRRRQARWSRAASSTSSGEAVARRQ